MKLILVGFLLLLATSVHSAPLEIISEYLCPLEMDSWNPVNIDSFQFIESGEMRILANRDFSFIRYPIKSWTIIIDSTGYLIYNPPDRYDIYVEIHSISSAGRYVL